MWFCPKNRFYPDVFRVELRDWLRTSPSFGDLNQWGTTLRGMPPEGNPMGLFTQLLQSLMSQFMIPKGLCKECFLTLFSKPGMRAVRTLKCREKTNQVKMCCSWIESPEYLLLRQNLKKKNPKTINSWEGNTLDRQMSPLTLSVVSLTTKISKKAVFLFWELSKKGLLNNRDSCVPFSMTTA